MAKEPTIHRFPKTHSLYKMKKGGVVKLRRMEDDEDKESFPMEEMEEVAEGEPGAAVTGAKPKKKSAVDYIKSKRREVS